MEMRLLTLVFGDSELPYILIIVRTMQKWMLQAWYTHSCSVQRANYALTHTLRVHNIYQWRSVNLFRLLLWAVVGLESQNGRGRTLRFFLCGYTTFIYNKICFGVFGRYNFSKQ